MPSETPTLQQRTPDPKGVMNKRFRVLVIVAVLAIVILSLAISSYHRPLKTKEQAAAPSPDLSQNGAVENRKSFEQTLENEQQQHPPAPEPAKLSPVPPASGQSATPQPVYGAVTAQQAQMSPAEQEAQQLMQQERQRAYNARFASNIVFSAGKAAPPRQEVSQGGPPQTTYGQRSNAEQPTQGQRPDSDQAAFKRKPEVNIDAATGQPYVVFEGTVIPCTLINRLDGDAVGPVMALVSQPLYSHDGQHVLIPDGTRLLGEGRKIGHAGFGQQRRIAVAFHRMIMPDGYSVDLDQFHGLDQIGEEGLKDQVNNHYTQIFGASIALALIGAAAQGTTSGSQLNGSGADALRYGASEELSQEGMTILSRFINIPPTITIREGNRLKVYISQDMLLPAFENHRIAQNF